MLRFQVVSKACNRVNQSGQVRTQTVSEKLELQIQLQFAMHATKERSMSGKFQFASGLLIALGLCSIGHTAEWVQTWGAAPQPPTPAMGPFPATPSFENATIRQLVRVSSGGRRGRIRL